MKSKKFYIITLIFIIITTVGIVLVLRSFETDKQKHVREDKPIKVERKTIYEINNHPEYEKTKINLPVHEGFLIAVYKDDHRLKLYKNGEIKKEYEVNVRRELEDRKIYEDSQTPEGVFYVDSMDIIDDNPWKRWIRIDTFEKAKSDYLESYSDGAWRIQEFENLYGRLESDKSLRQFNEINDDQKILRGIGIHGGGFDLYREWTLGCVAMKNEDVIELFNYISQNDNNGVGTPVIIMD